MTTTNEIEFFQVDGYDATIEAATAKFLRSNPNAKIETVAFRWAENPYTNSEGVYGRWVGLAVTWS